jgi:hypothetical protein
MPSKISAEASFHCSQAASTISTGMANSTITNNRNNEIRRMVLSQ